MLEEIFVRENPELQALSNRIILSEEPDCRSRSPIILETNHKIISVLALTLVTDNQCKQHLSMHVSPPRCVPFLHGSLNHSLAAGWFGCGTRVTGEFRVPQVFRDLTHRS